MDYASESLKKHYEWRGKLEVTPRGPLWTARRPSLWPILPAWLSPV